MSWKFPRKLMKGKHTANKSLPDALVEIHTDVALLNQLSMNTTDNPHSVDTCPLTKFKGGLQALYELEGRLYAHCTRHVAILRRLGATKKLGGQ